MISGQNLQESAKIGDYYYIPAREILRSQKQSLIAPQ